LCCDVVKKPPVAIPFPQIGETEVIQYGNKVRIDEKALVRWKI